MLDHISLGVSDLTTSAAFYDAVLAPMGYQRMAEFGPAIGYGAKFPAFWIYAAGDAATVLPGFHLALRAPDRAGVDAFHAAALAHGGTDDGAPGLRPQYHEHYYAAFVLDPTGHKIEAVHHKPA
jgi:catechol 2,3-dioxygenase-like lactoylglutathione lyase family enzyme